MEGAGQGETVDGQKVLTALKALLDGEWTTPLDEEGIGADIAKVYNDLTYRLRIVSGEISRISRELGTEGRFGGQAEIDGLTGSWSDLVGNVNLMGANLTNQFRDIANGVTARANGDMARRVTVSAEGEVQDLKLTLNVMGDQFQRFATEVRRVARTEKPAPPAEVPGLAGVWKEIADDVNKVASTRV